MCLLRLAIGCILLTQAVHAMRAKAAYKAAAANKRRSRRKELLDHLGNYRVNVLDVDGEDIQETANYLKNIASSLMNVLEDMGMKTSLDYQNVEGALKACEDLKPDDVLSTDATIQQVLIDHHLTEPELQNELFGPTIQDNVIDRLEQNRKPKRPTKRCIQSRRRTLLKRLRAYGDMRKKVDGQDMGETADLASILMEVLKDMGMNATHRDYKTMKGILTMCCHLKPIGNDVQKNMDESIQKVLRFQHLTKIELENEINLLNERTIRNREKTLSDLQTRAEKVVRKLEVAGRYDDGQNISSIIKQIDSDIEDCARKGDSWYMQYNDEEWRNFLREMQEELDELHGSLFES